MRTIFNLFLVLIFSVSAFAAEKKVKVCDQEMKDSYGPDETAAMIKDAIIDNDKNICSIIWALSTCRKNCTNDDGGPKIGAALKAAPIIYKERNMKKMTGAIEGGNKDSILERFCSDDSKVRCKSVICGKQAKSISECSKSNTMQTLLNPQPVKIQCQTGQVGDDCHCNAEKGYVSGPQGSDNVSCVCDAAKGYDPASASTETCACKSTDEWNNDANKCIPKAVENSPSRVCNTLYSMYYPPNDPRATNSEDLKLKGLCSDSDHSDKSKPVTQENQRDILNFLKQTVDVASPILRNVLYNNQMQIMYVPGCTSCYCRERYAETNPHINGCVEPDRANMRSLIKSQLEFLVKFRENYESEDKECDSAQQRIVVSGRELSRITSMRVIGNVYRNAYNNSSSSVLKRVDEGTKPLEELSVDSNNGDMCYTAKMAYFTKWKPCLGGKGENDRVAVRDICLGMKVYEMLTNPCLVEGDACMKKDNPSTPRSSAPVGARPPVVTTPPAATPAPAANTPQVPPVRPQPRLPVPNKQ